MDESAVIEQPVEDDAPIASDPPLPADPAELGELLKQTQERAAKLEAALKEHEDRKAEAARAAAKAEAERKKAEETELRAKLTDEQRAKVERDELAKQLEATRAELQNERRVRAIRDACKEEGIVHSELVEHLPAVTNAIAFDEHGAIDTSALAKALKAVKTKYGAALAPVPSGSPGFDSAATSRNRMNGRQLEPPLVR